MTHQLAAHVLAHAHTVKLGIGTVVFAGWGLLCFELGYRGAMDDMGAE